MHLGVMDLEVCPCRSAFGRFLGLWLGHGLLARLGLKVAAVLCVVVTLAVVLVVVFLVEVLCVLVGFCVVVVLSLVVEEVLCVVAVCPLLGTFALSLAAVPA